MAQVPRNTHSPSPGSLDDEGQVCAQHARGLLDVLEGEDDPTTPEEAFRQTQMMEAAKTHALLAVYEELRLQRSSTTKPSSGAA